MWHLELSQECTPTGTCLPFQEVETLLAAHLNLLTVTSQEADEIKSRPMCKLEEVAELRNHTVLEMLVYLFLVLMFFSIYLNIRLLVILCQRFAQEKKLEYFPMLMLLYILSMINQLILLAGCFLPFVIHVMGGELPEEWRAIVYPFVYSLIIPSEIALADVILCAQRLYIYKNPVQFTHTVISKWIGMFIFFLLCIPIGYISYHAQMYTVAMNKEQRIFIFVCFIIDNVFRSLCSIFSLTGYIAIYIWSKRKKNFDSILRQAMPIACFQTISISIQLFFEAPFIHFDPRDRIMLDICISTFCSIVVPLSVMAGEQGKRDMFYSSICCCYCYCEPRPRPPKPISEKSSKADRQKVEVEEALKERRREQEERRRRMDLEQNFHNLDESLDSNESVV